MNRMPLNCGHVFEHATTIKRPCQRHRFVAAPLYSTGTLSTLQRGLYEVQGVVRHSETLQPMVLYRALYGQRGLWVRPFDMFLETVQVEGRTVSRFTWIANDATAQAEAAV